MRTQASGLPRRSLSAAREDHRPCGQRSSPPSVGSSTARRCCRGSVQLARSRRNRPAASPKRGRFLRRQTASACRFARTRTIIAVLESSLVVLPRSLSRENESGNSSAVDEPETSSQLLHVIGVRGKELRRWRRSGQRFHVSDVQIGIRQILQLEPEIDVDPCARDRAIRESAFG